MADVHEGRHSVTNFKDFDGFFGMARNLASVFLRSELDSSLPVGRAEPCLVRAAFQPLKSLSFWRARFLTVSLSTNE